MIGRGAVDLSLNVLGSYMGFPSDWKITGVGWDAGRECLEVFVKGEGLCDCPNGIAPPRLRPIVYVERGANGLAAIRTEWPRFVDK